MSFAFPRTLRPAQADFPALEGGAVAVLLRAEALVECVCAMLLYRGLGGAWLLFASLFLVPDLGMLGYLIDRRVGARAYNLSHSYIGPALLAVVGFMLTIPLLYRLALIWAAHIGFDRALGYGLKYSVGFGATHLGWMGRHSGGRAKDQTTIVTVGPPARG